MSALPARAHGAPLGSLERMLWIGDIPARGAAACPERSALVFPDRSQQLSYAQLDAASNGFAAMLEERGLTSGARIVYLGRNSDLYYVVLFGAIRAGVVLVAVNWRLAPPEIAFQIADSGARWLLCDPELEPQAAKAMAELEAPPPLLRTEGSGGLRELMAGTCERGRQLRSAGSAPRARDQIILQLYTSGTTGTPKGVLLSHGALSIARHAELSSPDFAHVEAGCIVLSAMPNFHIGGMSWVLIGLVRLGTVVITAEPSALNILALMQRYEAQHTWLVPTLLRSLVDSLRTGGAVPRFKGLFYGAMPMDVDLLRESMQMFGCSFLQFFGMTEVGGAATELAPVDHLGRPALLRSVGKPYAGMSVEIRAPDASLLECGQPGEIWIRSPTLMQGYWNLPDKTAQALVDGWYATGDGGYLDEQGYLYLTDRIKDMIVTGGENVYPIEVEQVLRTHPAVLDVAVVGVPDARWGERVIALVEPRGAAGDGTAAGGAAAGGKAAGKATASADELLQFCRGKIADYKCPKEIRFVTQLPRTASGKVQRSAARQLLRQD